MRPDALLQLGRVGLDPAEDGRVVDRDATVLQHELEIAVADREHQIPAYRPEDHLGRKLPAFERLTLHPRPLSSASRCRLCRLPANPQTLQQSRFFSWIRM